ncbi:MAG: class I tRNA ligase family protein [Limisphaerales bacterium]
MTEIPKAYEPQSVEDKWYDFWLKQGCFTADPARVTDKRPAYSIVIPPPNVTGMLHMGHVLNNTIQDILARKARMDGKEVLWLPGTDHAGIATQVQVEKALKKTERKTRHDLGREEFLKRVWQWKEKHGGIIIQQLKKLGCSCDWTRERFTMDPEYSRCVQKVFVELYKKGLIYRGKRMVNWCPVSQTALSDEEVEMKPQKGFLYHFRVEAVELDGSPAKFTPQPLTPSLSPSDGERLADGPGEEKPGGPQIDSEGRVWLTIATTRPETIPGDTAVAVNPKDPRYAPLIGKYVIRPLPVHLPREKKLIPIIGDEHVDFEFGTGVLKVTPAHDKADFEIGQRHKLPIVDIMNPDGTMNELAGESLAGLDRFEARAQAVERLKELGAMVEEKPYENNVGFSQRADVPIEPRLSEQWFLKYPSVEQARACVVQDGGSGLGGTGELSVKDGDLSAKSAGKLPAGTGQWPVPPSKMRFHPQRWAKVYDHWLTNIQDWCISRQLWWGHRIPVWYNTEARSKSSKPISIIELTGNELAGSNIKELRDAAWEFANKHALLNRSFQNAETGWNIVVRPASLEHAFTHIGAANIKAVVALPELIRTAIKLGTLHHLPPDENFKAVHLFVAATRIGGELYQVKITVKEHLDGQKLYDHQLFKRGAPDGKSPTPAALASEPTRPASGAEILIADLIQDVNRDSGFTRCQIEEPGPGWTQDPDVLDTWFSSWLWPFATMGWPEQTETLKKFYPTTDLVTGPDIIFFWVARMIMAGYEFMGDLPFRNVYFTGIIRDKQGRKMSKTLGNSPDPLDLIAKYGADALRFGTMRSAPLGQDVLFDEKDVELGRNFCNKLWNACRFRQMQSSAQRETQGAECEGEINPALLTSDDKWILLRLDQAIREVSEALAGYNFSTAVQALYRFFWSEYCDWYVEASKAALYSEDAPLKANKLAVIDFVLGHTLRLFHPFLPFITEELWHGMGFDQDLPANQGDQTIMNAPWPKPFTAEEKEYLGLDDAADQVAAAKYELVGLGRNLRRELKLDPAKKLKFVLRPVGELPAAEVEVLKILLNAEAVEVVGRDWQPPKGTPGAANLLGEIFLPLAGLVDFAAERARLTKELEKIRAEIVKVEEKLNNPNFTQKVPAKVLDEHKQRLADWQTKREQVERALADLPA